jgi:hypothetical protein
VTVTPGGRATYTEAQPTGNYGGAIYAVNGEQPRVTSRPSATASSFTRPRPLLERLARGGPGRFARGSRAALFCGESVEGEGREIFPVDREKVLPLPVALSVPVAGLFQVRNRSNKKLEGSRAARVTWRMSQSTGKISLSPTTAIGRKAAFRGGTQSA